MNITKKTSMNIIILVSLSMIIVFAGIVSAFGWSSPNQENRTAIQQAIEDNDFEAWKTAMSAELTEENFNMIVDRYNKMFGNMTDMNMTNFTFDKSLMPSRDPNDIHPKDIPGNMTEIMGLQNEVKQAIQSGNYEAYKNAIGKLDPNSKWRIMSEDEFNEMVEKCNSYPGCPFCQGGGGSGRYHHGPEGGFDRFIVNPT